MNTEILGVALQILLLIVISYPLGKHIAKVYKEGNDCMRFMAPIERFIYKLAGINPNEEMDWKVFLKSLLIINVFWFFWGMGLNPAATGMSLTLRIFLGRGDIIYILFLLANIMNKCSK